MIVTANEKEGSKIRGRLFLDWALSLLFLTGEPAISHVSLTPLHVKPLQDAATNAHKEQIPAQDSSSGLRRFKSILSNQTLTACGEHVRTRG